MQKPTWTTRDNAETGKVDVVEIDADGNVLKVCDSFDGEDAARDAIEEYEEGWHDEQAARAAGDDPRFDLPDDPHAYQNELAQQWRDFVRGETEED